jgi:hypothetical protein
MDPEPSRERTLPPSEKQESLDLRSEIVAEAFLQLFELLQEYAPVWFTEQHYNRALAAHQIIQKSRGTAT